MAGESRLLNFGGVAGPKGDQGPPGPVSYPSRVEVRVLYNTTPSVHDQAEEWRPVVSAWAISPDNTGTILVATEPFIGIPAGESWRVEYSLNVRAEYGPYGSGDLNASFMYAMVAVDLAGNPTGEGDYPGLARMHPTSQPVSGDLSVEYETIHAFSTIKNATGATKYYRLMAYFGPDGMPDQQYCVRHANFSATRVG